MKAEIAKVTEHIDNNLAEGQLLSTAKASGDPVSKITAIWIKFRPIAALLSKFPFVPKKWKPIIQQFVDAMDLITGTVPV